MSFKDLIEIIYYIAGSIAALGTLIAAIFALCVYRSNSRLERARWASTLYERFYEKNDLKDMRNALDCSPDSDSISELVLREDSKFTDYLNFFEFIAFLQHSPQLGDSEVQDLFGYYLACLRRHDRVRTYINNPSNGYEGLARLLEKPR
jgi:hypothetical protein